MFLLTSSDQNTAKQHIESFHKQKKCNINKNKVCKQNFVYEIGKHKKLNISI